MPEAGLGMVSPAGLPHLRPCRLLRPVAAASTPPSISTTPSIPIIEGYDPPEGWGWCYVDEVMFDLTDRTTPQRGPIPKFV